MVVYMASFDMKANSGLIKPTIDFLTRRGYDVSFEITGEKQCEIMSEDPLDMTDYMTLVHSPHMVKFSRKHVL